MHYCLHGTFVRHMYSIVLGILIQSYLYGFAEGALVVALMSAIVYAIMMFMPRHKQAPVVMFTVLGFLSY